MMYFSSGFGPCQTLHCENGGTCIHVTVNKKTSPQCLCLPDFTGTNCSECKKCIRVLS